MKCLTVCEPFASALIFGGKIIENRTRPIGYVGPLLIHAGKSLDWFAPEVVEWLSERWSGCPRNPVRAMHEFKPRMGKIIGILWAGAAIGVDVLTPEQAEWGTGPTCIPCSTPRALTPTPIRGQQGVFMVPSADLPREYHDAYDDLVHIHTEAEARQ